MDNGYIAFRIRKERIESIVNGWNYYKQRLVEHGIAPHGVLPKFFGEMSDILYDKRKKYSGAVQKVDVND